MVLCCSGHSGLKPRASDLPIGQQQVVRSWAFEANNDGLEYKSAVWGTPGTRHPEVSMELVGPPWDPVLFGKSKARTVVRDSDFLQVPASCGEGCRKPSVALVWIPIQSGHVAGPSPPALSPRTSHQVPQCHLCCQATPPGHLGPSSLDLSCLSDAVLLGVCTMRLVARGLVSSAFCAQSRCLVSMRGSELNMLVGNWRAWCRGGHRGLESRQNGPTPGLVPWSWAALAFWPLGGLQRHLHCASFCGFHLLGRDSPCHPLPLPPTFLSSFGAQSSCLIPSFRSRGCLVT